MLIIPRINTRFLFRMLARPMLKFMICALLPIDACLMSCSASHKTEPDESLTIRPTTVLPLAFGGPVSQTEGRIIIPAGIVDISTVNRPMATIRKGPGSEFPVKDQLLSKGEGLIVQATKGVWNKVSDIGGHPLGWVHRGYISPWTSNQRPMKLLTKSLATISVVEPIAVVYEFQSHKMHRVKIPKGTQIRVFKNDGQAYLAWVPNTNSVVWIDKHSAW